MSTSSSDLTQALALARFLPPSLHGAAALSHLTNSQRAELFDWSDAQRNNSSNSVVNLLDWPDWSGVGADPSANIERASELAAA